MPGPTTQPSLQRAESALSRPWLLRSQPTGRHEQLVKNTQKFVSQVFFGQILRQMRQSPFRSEMFSGGKAGQTFETLFDQQLADRMSCSSTGRTLVNSIVKRLERKASDPSAPSLLDEARRGLRAARTAPAAQPSAAETSIDVRG